MTDDASSDPWHVTDGVITIRPPRPGDAAVLVAGRDAEWARWMGPGSDDPRPTACIVRDGSVIGWVDFDHDQEWLAPDEVNVGYNVFADQRRRGHASRAVMLLLHRIALENTYRRASVVINRDNVGSLRVAERARFAGRREMGKNDYLSRAVPPLTYTDGVVRIRRQKATDLDADLSARDNHDAFGSGPKWAFSVDAGDTPCVARVDCNLSAPDLPPGEANISYSCHPAHRGRGHVSRAVRLLLRFVAEHTGARRAHLVIQRGNEASLRVARSVTAAEPEPAVDDQRRPAWRFVVDMDRFAAGPDGETAV